MGPGCCGAVKNVFEFLEVVFNVLANGGGNFNVTACILKPHECGSLLNLGEHGTACQTQITFGELSGTFTTYSRLRESRAGILSTPASAQPGRHVNALLQNRATPLRDAHASRGYSS